MQQFDKSKGYLQHFGQFATITAGRKNVNFEYEKIKEHIKIWVNLLIKLKKIIILSVIVILIGIASILSTYALDITMIEC